MGKRLEDLNLGDSGPTRRDDLAISRREADRFLAELDALEADETYEFAWGTIIDMRATVNATGRVTEGQRTAIDNIKAGAARHEEQLEGWRRHERRTGRRYDGFNGRYR